MDDRAKLAAARGGPVGSGYGVRAEGRFGWKPGDFVLWDNLATWHYAVNDYDGPREFRKFIGG